MRSWLWVLACMSCMACGDFAQPSHLAADRSRSSCQPAVLRQAILFYRQKEISLAQLQNRVTQTYGYDPDAGEIPLPLIDETGPSIAGLHEELAQQYRELASVTLRVQSCMSSGEDASPVDQSHDLTRLANLFAGPSAQVDRQQGWRQAEHLAEAWGSSTGLLWCVPTVTLASAATWSAAFAIPIAAVVDGAEQLIDVHEAGIGSALWTRVAWHAVEHRPVSVTRRIASWWPGGRARVELDPEIEPWFSQRARRLFLSRVTGVGESSIPRLTWRWNRKARNVEGGPASIRSAERFLEEHAAKIFVAIDEIRILHGVRNFALLWPLTELESLGSSRRYRSNRIDRDLWALRWRIGKWVEELEHRLERER